ncbi:MULTISPECIES: EF-hand domain-containing protein [unclassified Polaromonas]|uniref:EF-hand domain-containing protein n=1 Tax=unclassified Polaromonas TaxID=2638319 RepID=UPI000F075A69|nr:MULTISPECIES: EF-hand domain-containing protein [unclassified Polaromonas]AYQ27695.1 EF-hand domain-containing protein [Polaromonas sp. SP1]QGJ17455.1 EF-hand domain-containing protein [Polaromonas sp. Pch-P]
MTLHTTAKQQPKHSIPHFSGSELRSVLLVAALAVGAAGAVRAQTSPASPNSPPSKVAPAAPSANSGAVPQNRATTQDVEAAFNRADANKDGKLDRQEAEHFPAVAQRFEQIDTNRDTFISLAELAKAASGS